MTHKVVGKAVGHYFALWQYFCAFWYIALDRQINVLSDDFIKRGYIGLHHLVGNLIVLQVTGYVRVIGSHVDKGSTFVPSGT